EPWGAPGSRGWPRLRHHCASLRKCLRQSIGGCWDRCRPCRHRGPQLATVPPGEADLSSSTIIVPRSAGGSMEMKALLPRMQADVTGAGKGSILRRLAAGGAVAFLIYIFGHGLAFLTQL